MEILSSLVWFVSAAVAIFILIFVGLNVKSALDGDRFTQKSAILSVLGCIGAAVIFLAGLTLAHSFGVIDNTQVGLQKTWGAYNGVEFAPGMYMTAPISTSVDKIDITTKHAELDTTAFLQGNQQTLNVNGKQVTQQTGNQEVTVHATINYNLDRNPTKLRNTASLLGTDPAQYYDRAIKSQFQQSLKAVLQKKSFNAVNNNLDQVTSETVTETTKRVKEVSGADAIQVSQVTLKVEPSKEVRDAMNDQQKAYTEAQTANVQNQKAQFEANSRVIQATADANIQKLKADKTSEKSLSVKRLEIEAAKVEKWDGHIPPSFGGGSTILDARSIMGAVK